MRSPTLAQNLDQMGFFPRTHAVFGAMHDKDLAAILTRMAPLVDHWHFTDLPRPRAARAADLARRCMTGSRVQGPGPVTVSCHADPAAALARRVERPTPLIESSSSAPSTPWAVC